MAFRSLRDTSMTNGRNLALMFILAILVGTTYLSLPQTSAPRERTFYIVVYSWGFAFYDEKFNEVQNIVVKKGDLVTLHAMPAEALVPAETNKMYERTVKNGLGKLKAGDPMLVDVVKRAREYALLRHTVTIAEFGLSLVTDGAKAAGRAQSVSEAVQARDRSIDSVKFTADKVGPFIIYCSDYECGYGHLDMFLPNGLVVQG